MVNGRAAATSFIERDHGAFIGGRERPALGGRVFDSVDPATGARLTSHARCGPADVDAAVEVARTAFNSTPWRNLSPLDRGDLLLRLANLIEANADDLSYIESRDNGKPIRLARRVEVNTSVNILKYFAGWPSKFGGRTVPVAAKGVGQFLNYTVHEPIGVVGAIVPWNFPLSMAMWKVAPALAMGNCMILKPAEETSLTALRMAELATEAGFPDGVLNVVTGFGAEAGAAISRHPGIGKVGFTGSTETGRTVVRDALGNMKRVSLELGGKSPNIVLPDADPLVVAQGAADAIFFNQGQVCTAGSRLYVHEAIFDDVVDAVRVNAEKLVIGPGTDAATDLGPLVSETHLNRIRSFVDGAREEGASLATGGRSLAGEVADENGFYFRPTVLTDVTDGMTAVREEIFGPVLTAQSWSEVDELVVRANDSRYGLSAGVWTNDLGKAHQLAREIKAGTIWVNCFNVTDPASPFGGYKQSGWGREMGEEVLSSYTETKSVWINMP